MQQLTFSVAHILTCVRVSNTHLLITACLKKLRFFFTQGSCNYCLMGFFSQTAALKQLIGLYIGRCHACWKQPEVVQWLERNVKEVMKRVDRKDSFVEECSKK